MRRKDVISWDNYFMGIAHLSALRSKDPFTQVGACIVTAQKKVVGIGYNGFPTGINDDDLPWEREGEFVDTKYAYVVHAELNAILNATTSLQGCTMYVSLFPCNECAKAIVQAGITTLVYECDKYAHTPAVIAAKKIFDYAKVTLIALPHDVSVSLKVYPHHDK